MAKLQIVGITYLKMGLAGLNGSMSSELKEIPHIKMDSVVFGIPDPDKKEIAVEESDDPILTLYTHKSKTIVFETHDVSNDMLKTVFGGAIAANVLTPGINYQMPDQSVEIKTRSANGKVHILRIPKCSFSASMDAKLTKGDVASLKLMGTILTPYDENGIALASWSKEEASV